MKNLLHDGYGQRPAAQARLLAKLEPHHRCANCLHRRDDHGPTLGGCVRGKFEGPVRDDPVWSEEWLEAVDDFVLLGCQCAGFVAQAVRR